MTARVLSTAWTLAGSEAEQDAGGRRERGTENAPPESNGYSVSPRLATVSREVGSPGQVQGAREALHGMTGVIGEAREQAVSFMRIRGTIREVPRLFPGLLSVRHRFLALQEWEGTVLSRGEDSIRVRLVDKTNGGLEEDAEIMLEEVSPHDRALIKTGAAFYWIIGYHDSATGQRSRQSMIVFRRLPAWTDSELEAMRRKVRKQSALFRWT